MSVHIRLFIIRLKLLILSQVVRWVEELTYLHLVCTLDIPKHLKWTSIHLASTFKQIFLSAFLLPTTSSLVTPNRIFILMN